MTEPVLEKVDWESIFNTNDKDSWATAETEAFLQKIREEALSILKEKNTNVYSACYGYKPDADCILKRLSDNVKFVLCPDFRYESNGDAEYVRCYLPKASGSHYRREILKYKDLIIERDEYANTISVIKGGIRTTANLERGKSYAELLCNYFTHTDKEGIERKLYIAHPDYINYAMNINLTNYETAIASGTHRLKDKEYFDEIYFSKVSEKLPDGTYREFDKKGNIVSEELPDGTSIKWYNTYGEDKRLIEKWEKRVTKGNETAIYKNYGKDYAGKIVNVGDSVYHYNAKDNLIKKVTGDVTETFYENGNIKTREEKNGLIETYYDPDNPQKVLAYREGSMYYITSRRIALQSSRYKEKDTYILKDIDLPYNEDAEKGLLKCLKMAMEKGDTKVSCDILAPLVMGLAKLGNPDHFVTDYSFLCRNDFINSQTKILDDGKVVLCGVFEDRHWEKELYLGGTEWYWKAAAVVIDVKNGGLVASCTTSALNVRDRYNSNRDLWDKLDNEFIEIDPKTGVMTVGFRTNKEYGHEWKESVKMDLKGKIEEYNKFVASKTPTNAPAINIMAASSKKSNSL